MRIIITVITLIIITTKFLVLKKNLPSFYHNCNCSTNTTKTGNDDNAQRKSSNLPIPFLRRETGGKSAHEMKTKLTH